MRVACRSSHVDPVNWMLLRIDGRHAKSDGLAVIGQYDYDAFWLTGPQIDVHPPAPWQTGLIYDETRETRRWIFPSLPDWDIDPSIRRKPRNAGRGNTPARTTAGTNSKSSAAAETSGRSERDPDGGLSGPGCPG